MNYVERIVARQQKEYRQETYINFKKSIIVKLKKRELEEKLELLDKEGYTIVKHTTMRANFPPKSYSLTYNDHLIKLSYFDGTNFYWCITNYHDDMKNVYTPNSFRTFKNMFKKRTGIKIKEAYGHTEQAFKEFCPKPLYYINPLFDRYLWYSGVSKEDYNSHYPAAALGILPDASTRKEVKGFVLPNSEYEFAFYPDSGNIAVFNEFDTHNYLSYVKTYTAHVKTRITVNYNAKDTKTILMKRAKHTLDEEMMYFYNIKCTSPKESKEYYDSKIFLLKFIGMLEQVSSKMYASYPFAHLAAVIKWRANIKMFNTLKQIGFRNVIQVCVDGVIHTGTPLGIKTSEIGELNLEATDAFFIQRGINQYIIKNKTFKEVKHTGLDVNVDSDNVMTWMASDKVDFLTYIKKNYVIEELL